MIFKSTCIALVVVVSVFGQSLTKDNQRIEPFQIADNLYYIGSSDIAVYLLTTPIGAILIDRGYIETAPMVVANVAKLGFHVTDVKILLNTQAHSDPAAA